jgi:hypothetical protein
MNAPASITQLAGVAQADHISQATAVEQARAVAEVAAAVQVAQQNPRNIDTARRSLQASCSMHSLAQQAFYDFNQGGRVHGETATLARELGRCWGNFQSGTDELRRDTEKGYSEMRVWAWDLESNARRSTTFVVPHERDGKVAATLTSVRDIRNNNNNWAARGEREMILSTLPAWFVDEATALCQKTLDRGDGTSVEERRDKAVAAYQTIGVAVERIERKLGSPKDSWTVFDLAQLTQVHKAITRGMVAIDDEFPAAAVTISAITSTATRAPAKQQASRPNGNGSDPKPAGELEYAPDDDGRTYAEGDGA